MTGRYVLRNKTDNTYYRANRKGSWDNWVDNINLATVFYTTAINTQHRCMKDCEVVYINFVEEAMMKLKDEGIVKPLKDSILRNERLSSQEQQELCAWIECAMDFGENLDECAKELEEANKANEWHYVKDGDYPKDNKPVLCILGDIDSDSYEVGYYNDVESGEPWHFETYQLPDDDGDNAWGVFAWKEIVLPELKEVEK